MKIPPAPTTTNPLVSASSEDDFSFYFSFFQDALCSFPPSPDAAAPADMPRRKRPADGDPTADVPSSKKRSIAKILTSLAALEDQDAADRRDADAASLRDLSDIRSNHQSKLQATLQYFDRVKDQFDDADQSDSTRSKRARLAASTAAAAAAANLEQQQQQLNPQDKQQHQQRRLWVKDRSRAWWERCSHPDFPEAEFRRAFRMSKATFDMICDELGSVVAKEDTMLRAAIPVRQRVAVCIWRLATGDPLRLVSKRFGLGISTCHKLVLEVCSAIKTVLMPKFLQWPDQQACASIKSRFEAISGIPNVIGSMYTTHIPIIAPKVSVAAYFNRRHTERNQKTSYSITVQGVVDPDGVFTDVCIGWPGSMPDDQVLEKSALYQRAQSGMLKNTWVVGSSGYPLMDWVLVPYTHQNLTWTQHAFNEKIGEVQRVSKDAFARLKGRWACLQKRTEVKLQDLPVVLGACCVLHNICEIRKDEMDPEHNFELVDDEMVPENSLRSMSSMQARDNIAHNLLHHGLAGTNFLLS